MSTNILYTGTLGRSSAIGQYQQVPRVRARGAEAARVRAARHRARRRRGRGAGPLASREPGQVRLA